jgi:guanylate kinase
MTLKLLGNSKRGLVFIISAPAGTGKTTLVDLLRKEFDCVIQSISFTTRKPRDNEIDGVHYHFISEDEFKKRIDEGDFLEHAHLFSNYYGTSRVWLEEQVSKGKYVVLVIDTQGAHEVRKKIPHASIFIMPPSLVELRRRITERKTESVKSIDQRLDHAQVEIERSTTYDYIIVNDDLDNAYEVLRSVFIAEEHKVTH